jgi:DNA-binding CsgD family transcriptional regulator
MLIGNTDMHVVTFLFIIFEIVMFGYQFILYLSRPQEKTRKFYLILLTLLIAKNTASGLFPDPDITSIPLIIQYGITYGAGFVMASYFPYYFYRAYNLHSMKWHATKGIFYFLHIPFFSVFITEYLITKNIDSAINHGLYIPAVYGLFLGYSILKGIQARLREDIDKYAKYELMALFVAVIPYATLAFCAYFRISQVKEVILTNGGFTIITILFVRNSIKQSREEYEKLQLLNNYQKTKNDELEDNANIIIEENMTRYLLSERQKEVARLVLQGWKYREIGDNLFISLGTVEKHIEHIFKKTSVNNRKDLREKLQDKFNNLTEKL